AQRDPDGAHRRFLLNFRGGDQVRAFVDGRDLERYANQGTATPDHVIRIKPWPLILPAADARALDEFATACKRAVELYADRYRAYFAQHNQRLGGIKTMLDPVPRLALVPGLGLFG